MSAHDAQPKPESIPPVVPAKVAYVAPTKAKGPPIGFDLQVPVHSVAPMHWKPQPQLPPRAQQEPQAKSTSGLLGKVGNPQPRWKAFPKEQNPGKAAKPPIKEPPHSCTSCTTHQQSVPVVMHWKPPPPLLQQSAAAADPNALQPGPLAKSTMDLLGKATKPPIKAPPPGSASGSGYWPQAPGSNLPMPTKPAPPLPPQHNAQAADPKTWQPEPTSQKEMLRLMDAFLSRHPPRVKAASAQTAGQVPKAQAAAQTAGQVPFGQQTTSQAPLAQAAAQAAEQPPQPDDESVPGCQWTSFQMPKHRQQHRPQAKCPLLSRPQAKRHLHKLLARPRSSHYHRCCHRRRARRLQMMNRCQGGRGPDQSRWRSGPSHSLGSAQPGRRPHSGRGPAACGGLGGLAAQVAAGPGLILLGDARAAMMCLVERPRVSGITIIIIQHC